MMRQTKATARGADGAARDARHPLTRMGDFKAGRLCAIPAGTTRTRVVPNLMSPIHGPVAEACAGMRRKTLDQLVAMTQSAALVYDPLSRGDVHRDVQMLPGPGTPFLRRRAA